MRYHMTCKYLGDSNYTVADIIDILSGIRKDPPTASLISWEPVIFENDKEGIKVLLVRNCPYWVSDCHSALNVIRKNDYSEYRPHITIDDITWAGIKMNNISPQEMGIAFGPLTLKRRGIIIHQFKNRGEEIYERIRRER